MNLLARRLSCPYCYHRINGRRLWYQCTGRGSPGRPGCREANDPVRTHETGYAQATRPVFGPAKRGIFSAAQAECPSCGGNMVVPRLTSVGSQHPDVVLVASTPSPKRSPDPSGALALSPGKRCNADASRYNGPAA